MTPGARPQPQLTPAVGHQPTLKPFHPGQKHACCSMPPAHNHLIYCSMPKITGLGRAGLPPKINNSHCLLPLQQHGCCQLPTGPGTAPGHGWDKPLGRCSAASPSSLPPPGNSGGGPQSPSGGSTRGSPPFPRHPAAEHRCALGNGAGGSRSRGPSPFSSTRGEGAAVRRVLRAVVAGASAWWLAGGFCTGCTRVLCKTKGTCVSPVIEGRKKNPSHPRGTAPQGRGC